jgi:hypothetical protein
LEPPGQPHVRPVASQARIRLGDNIIAHPRQFRPADQRDYFAQPDKPAKLILDGPLLPADWTVELNYWPPATVR